MIGQDGGEEIKLPQEWWCKYDLSLEETVSMSVVYEIGR